MRPNSTAHEVVKEIHVTNTNLDEFARHYAGSKAAIKATINDYTIYDTLNDHLDVVVANPYQTKARHSAEVKNNWLDEVVRATSRRAG